MEENKRELQSDLISIADGEAAKPNIILISGISGSGKSSALKILEDKGFFCVDNMPMALLPKFFELGLSAKLKNILFIVDIREKSFLNEFEDYVKFLRLQSSFFKYIFLEARDEAVIKRYSETRRKHPLPADDINIAVREERQLLKNIKLHADVVLDTTDVNIHELDGILLPHIGDIIYNPTFSVKILSFGFKYGLPLEADTIFDARFLPNPFFVPLLKDLTGFNREVREYMLSFNESNNFIEHIVSFLKFSLPLYRKESKSYFTVGIGCTGGVHRSVFIAEELKNKLGNVNDEYGISYYHRDVNK
ncbi:MAG: RNase adapter RapZ [Deltaproteobacteria bacterium]|nr:RNase adapter RapZ [Deltaproteobacteria bacterium]